MNTIGHTVSYRFKPHFYRIAIAGFFLFCGCTFASWASRIPTIKETFNLNEAQLGSILFLLPTGAVSVLPLAGWAISKYGSRIITITTAIGYALNLLSLAFVSNTTELSVALFFFGFFGNGLNISMNTQALQVQDEMYRRPLMSSFHAMWSAGAMIGALTGGYMMKSGASLLYHFGFLFVVMTVLYVFLYFYLVPADKPHESGRIFSWPSKGLWLLGIICFCCTLCEGAMADWSSLYYMQVVNEGNKVNTIGYTAFALMMALGRLVGDKLVDRFGARKIIVFDGLLIATGLAIGVGIVHPAAVIVGFGIIGIGVSTIIPIVYTLAGKNSKMAPGIALSAVSSIGFAGFLVGPPVIGFIAHAIGLRFALLLLVSLGMLIVWLSRLVRS